MVQIFVKVDGSKVTPMEVSLTDDKVEDVMRRIQKDEGAYVTMQGKVLRTSEKLKSYRVTDGCTIQVTSRMRGGGRHKDKKKGSEKKQTASAKGNEQNSVKEPESGRGPVLLDCYSSAVDRMIQESEGYQEFIEQLSKGSEVEMEQTMQRFVATARGFSGQEHNPVEILESGIRRAVARRTGRGTEREQDRRVRFAEEEHEQRHDEEERRETDEEDERGRVAPNIGAGGSHLQATSDPGKEEKEKKET